MDYESFEYLRDKKQVRNIDIARAIAMSPVVFSEWKKGKSVPKHDKMIKIARYFGVDEDFSIWNNQEDTEKSDEHKKYMKEHFITEDELVFMNYFRMLDEIDRLRILERIGTLLEDDKYKKASMEGGEVG